MTKHLTDQVSVGLSGYDYRQFTADSGPGAKVGRFMGRVDTIGGTIGYAFKIGQFPISARLKVFREFDVQNRLQGSGGFVTISLPLYVMNAGVH